MRRLRSGDLVKIRDGWAGAGRSGVVLDVVFAIQEWCVVKFDDDDDPDCFKAGGLELIPRTASRSRGRILP